MMRILFVGQPVAKNRYHDPRAFCTIVAALLGEAENAYTGTVAISMRVHVNLVPCRFRQVGKGYRNCRLMTIVHIANTGDSTTHRGPRRAGGSLGVPEANVSSENWPDQTSRFTCPENGSFDGLPVTSWRIRSIA